MPVHWPRHKQPGRGTGNSLQISPQLNAGADATQDINLLALQPAPAKQIAKPRHQPLGLCRVKKTDFDQYRFEMGIETLDLLMSREGRSRAHVQMLGPMPRIHRRLDGTRLERSASQRPGEYLDGLRQIQ